MLYKLTLVALCVSYNLSLACSEQAQRKKIAYKHVNQAETSSLATDPFDDQLPDSASDSETVLGFSNCESPSSTKRAKQISKKTGPTEPSMQDQEEAYADQAIREVTSNSLRITTPKQYCLCNAWICSGRGLERKT